MFVILYLKVHIILCVISQIELNFGFPKMNYFPPFINILKIGKMNETIGKNQLAMNLLHFYYYEYCKIS